MNMDNWSLHAEMQASEPGSWDAINGRTRFTHILLLVLVARNAAGTIYNCAVKYDIAGSTAAYGSAINTIGGCANMCNRIPACDFFVLTIPNEYGNSCWPKTGASTRCSERSTMQSYNFTQHDWYVAMHLVANITWPVTDSQSAQCRCFLWSIWLQHLQP